MLPVAKVCDKLFGKFCRGNLALRGVFVKRETRRFQLLFGVRFCGLGRDKILLAGILSYEVGVVVAVCVQSQKLFALDIAVIGNVFADFLPRADEGNV